MNDKFFKAWFVFCAVFGVALSVGVLYLLYLLVQKL